MAIQILCRFSLLLLTLGRAGIVHRQIDLGTLPSLGPGAAVAKGEEGTLRTKSGDCPQTCTEIAARFSAAGTDNPSATMYR
jgi:hypothetical protein